MPETRWVKGCAVYVSKVDSKLKDVPILFLTAKCEPDERVKGFERGADDYLTKPFDNRELVARTEAILARTIKRKLAISGKLEAGPIILDPESHEVVVSGKLVDPDAHCKVHELLHLMMEKNCAGFKKQGKSSFGKCLELRHRYQRGEGRWIICVGRLRGKLGEVGDLIKTVRGSWLQAGLGLR